MGAALAFGFLAFVIFCSWVGIRKSEHESGERKAPEWMLKKDDEQR